MLQLPVFKIIVHHSCEEIDGWGKCRYCTERAKAFIVVTRDKQENHTLGTGFSNTVKKN